MAVRLWALAARTLMNRPVMALRPMPGALPAGAALRDGPFFFVPFARFAVVLRVAMVIAFSSKLARTAAGVHVEGHSEGREGVRLPS